MGKYTKALAKTDIRARARELTAYSSPAKRSAVVAGLLDVIDGAKAHVQRWSNSQGEHETPAPQWDVVRKAWMDIARVVGILDPDVVLALGMEARPIDALADAAVTRADDRRALYAALRRGGHAAEAVRELAVVDTEGEAT